MKKVVKKVYESGKPVKLVTKEIDETEKGDKPSSKPDKNKDK